MKKINLGAGTDIRKNFKDLLDYEEKLKKDPTDQKHFVAIINHAQPKAPEEDIYRSSDLDPPITKRGMESAKKTGEFLNSFFIPF